MIAARYFLACVLMFTLSYSRSSGYEVEDVTRVPVDFDPNLNSSTIYACYGSLQVDNANESNFLIGLSTRSSLNKAGGLVTIPIQQVTGYTTGDGIVRLNVTKIAGSINDSKLTPNTDWDIKQQIQSVYYMQQTGDGNRIMWADDFTCVREYDRSTKRITTLLGKASKACGIHTIDRAKNFKGVAGLAYDETNDHIYVSVINEGVYLYSRPQANANYTGRLVIRIGDLSTSSLSDDTNELLLIRNFLWHKVEFGINRYDISSLNQTWPQQYDNDTFVRFISAAKPPYVSDYTARYQYNDDDHWLTRHDADMSMSPDNTTLTLLEPHEDRVSFLSIDNGTVSRLCENLTATICRSTKKIITAGVWHDQYTYIAYDRLNSSFEVVRFVEPTTTFPPTNATANAASRSTTTSDTIGKSNSTGNNSNNSQPPNTESPESDFEPNESLPDWAIAPIVIGAILVVGGGTTTLVCYCCCNKCILITSCCSKSKKTKKIQDSDRKTQESYELNQ